MRYDLALQDDLLGAAEELVKTAYPNDPPGGPYSHVVRQRLYWGEQHYGDAFRTRDNLLEALEESPDASAYTILELERLRDTGKLTEDDLLELRMHAVGVLAAARHLDTAVRRLQAARNGFLGPKHP